MTTFSDYLTTVSNYIKTIGVADMFDILIVAFLIYSLVRLIRSRLNQVNIVSSLMPPIISVMWRPQR